MQKIFCIVIFILILSFFPAFPTFAATSFIETLTKIRISQGYIFKINYRTEAEWTDGLVFKLICSFSKGPELSFMSSGFNNIKEGWHKTEIEVPKVYRDRYGYIEDYRLELYHNGILVSMKSL